MEGLLRKALALWDDFSAVDAETYASSMAYFTFLSLVPSLALCISLVSVVGIGEQDVANLLAGLMPEALEDLMRALVGDAFRSSGVAFSLSSVTLVWSASKSIKALRKALNASYAEHETRSAPAVAVISVLAAIVLGVMAAGLMCLVFSDGALRAVARLAPDLHLPSRFMDAQKSMLVLLVSTLILTCCYTYLPAGRRRLSDQLPGAALAMLGSAILSFGYRLYVDQFGNYTLLYGSIATVALLLVWMFFVSNIIIFGGVVNRALAEARREQDGE